MTLLLLASLYADEGEYVRALELAAQLSRDLPGERVSSLVRFLVALPSKSFHRLRGLRFEAHRPQYPSQQKRGVYLALLGC